ncbi:MAG: four helix bundle protein [Epsilonproteobacteria bacterium]|nr:four helix bundle protein [Campylobacterota bacterium]
MNENILVDKSFAFAIRVVKLYKYLCDEKKEYVLSKQLLRSGTSIGANINESQEAQSKNDFIEILKLLTTIIKSTKSNLKENNAK